MKRFIPVQITEETKAKLANLKEITNNKTFDGLLLELIDFYTLNAMTDEKLEGMYEEHLKKTKELLHGGK